MLEGLGVQVRRVTLPRHMSGLDGLVIPGGESTTIGKLMVEWELFEPVRSFGRSGGAIFGSCAGAILLAHDAGRPQPLLGLMDLQVARNAFGRQIDSFQADLTIPVLGARPFPGIFIRAPKITAVGDEAQVLCTLPDTTVVAAQQGRLLAVSFHAELTHDTRLHEYFVTLARQAPRAAVPSTTVAVPADAPGGDGGDGMVSA